MTSRLRVWQPDASKLVVVCPGFHAAALVVGICFLLGLAMIFLLARLSGQRIPGILLLTAALPCACVAWAVSRSYVAVLDVGNDDVAITKRVFGITKPVAYFHVSDIASVSTNSGRGAKQLVFMLKDGSTIPLGSMTNQGGQVEAKQSVSEFLSKHAIPAKR